MVIRCAAALLAAILGAAASVADEAEILAHYDAYSAAFDAGRFDEADAEGEAAWRAAESDWGASEDTAVLALNVARLRLMTEQRAAAIEPALRVKELVEAEVGGASIAREEAALLVALAQFPDADPGDDQMDALEAALTAYTPTDFTGTRIRGAGWFQLTNARLNQRQWRKTYEAADRATLLMEGDANIPPELLGTIAAFGVAAAAEDRKYREATLLGHRAIAAFPPQPTEQRINPVLGNLLGWDAGLHNILAQLDEDLDEEDYPEPEWNEGRYPTVMGCEVEWVSRTQPDYPERALLRGQVMAVIFEYYLDADGAVIRVDPVGNLEDDPGFIDAVVEAIGAWRASPQPRAECRGPWAMSMDFMLSNSRR